MTTLTPRHKWLQSRVHDIIGELYSIAHIEDWQAYRAAARELAEELHYAVTEWDKYYNDELENC